jgi:hypothetical protein
MICDEEDLIGCNMFTIDGCKIKLNASKQWSGTLEELERKKAKPQHPFFIPFYLFTIFNYFQCSYVK